MHPGPRLILIRVILVLASTFAGLLICEELVRVVAPQGVEIPWRDEVNGISTMPANIRARLAIPNTFDVTVSTNSERFRGRNEFKLEPPSSVLRIVTLGDSITFGFGANDDETYPAQLEQILSTSLGPNRIEVINAGVGDTGTGDQALWYDIWVKRFHPHLVVLGVSGSDVDDDLARSLFELGASGKASPRSPEDIRRFARRPQWVYQLNALRGYRFLTEHSHLVNLLRLVVGLMLDRKREPTYPTSAMSPQMKSAAKHRWEEGLALTMGEVSWLRERAQESGTQLVVVFVPEREVIHTSQTPQGEAARWKSDAITKALGEVCSRKNIPFADLMPRLRERAEQLRDPLYYAGRDTHPNARGYREMAEAIASFLLDKGLVRRREPKGSPDPSRHLAPDVRANASS